eukprot:scaffold1637_cov253-Pinguiococcus_pyrenoidosus.AAC.15
MKPAAPVSSTTLCSRTPLGGPTAALSALSRRSPVSSCPRKAPPTFGFNAARPPDSSDSRAAPTRRAPHCSSVLASCRRPLGPLIFGGSSSAILAPLLVAASTIPRSHDPTISRSRRGQVRPGGPRGDFPGPSKRNQEEEAHPFSNLRGPSLHHIRILNSLQRSKSRLAARVALKYGDVRVRPR